MRPPQLQSDSERTLERLIKEKKGADGETWSSEARAAFEEYIRGTYQMNSMFHYMRLLGPDVVASVVARAWKGMSESSRAAFLEGCRSRKNDLKTLVSLAERFLEEKEDGDARTLLSVLAGRLGRVDQPDSLKEAEQFANAGGLHRAARAMRLAFDEPDAIDRSLVALVGAAERLVSEGWKKPQKYLVRLAEALTGALDERHPGLDRAHALVQKLENMTAISSKPRDGQPSRATAAGERGAASGGPATHEGRAGAAARTGTAGRPLTQADASAAASTKGELPLRRDGTGDAEARHPAQAGVAESSPIESTMAPLRELTAWAESVEQRLRDALDVKVLRATVFGLDERLSALESAVERDRASAMARLGRVQEELDEAVAERDTAIATYERLKVEYAERAQVLQDQRRAAFEERDEAVEQGRRLEREVEEQKAARKDEEQALDRALKDLPRQRVEEFKKRLEGRLHPIVSELEEPTDGIDPLHHLDVLLDRWRALRDVLRAEGVLNG